MDDANMHPVIRAYLERRYGRLEANPRGRMNSTPLMADGPWGRVTFYAWIRHPESWAVEAECATGILHFEAVRRTGTRLVHQLNVARWFTGTPGGFHERDPWREVPISEYR